MTCAGLRVQRTTTRAKKTAYALGLKVNEVREKANDVRLGLCDGINVVFADKDEANRAKQHIRRLSSSLHVARVKGDQWYLLKFENVVKHCVLDQDVNDGKTLKKGFPQNCKAKHGCGTANRTVMKADTQSQAVSICEVMMDPGPYEAPPSLYILGDYGSIIATRPRGTSGAGAASPSSRKGVSQRHTRVIEAAVG